MLAGAAGYLVKQIGGSNLVDAIRRVAQGESLLDAAATEALLERWRLVSQEEPGTVPLRSRSGRAWTWWPRVTPTRRSPLRSTCRAALRLARCSPPVDGICRPRRGRRPSSPDPLGKVPAMMGRALAAPDALRPRRLGRTLVRHPSSLTNLSSTGLADVVWVTAHARSAVMIQQLAGLAYVALLFSRLVGLTLARRW